MEKIYTLAPTQVWYQMKMKKKLWKIMCVKDPWINYMSVLYLNLLKKENLKFFNVIFQFFKVFFQKCNILPTLWQYKSKAQHHQCQCTTMNKNLNQFNIFTPARSVLYLVLSSWITRLWQHEFLLLTNLTELCELYESWSYSLFSTFQSVLHLWQIQIHIWILRF
jgi:hypothetical protein